MANSVKTYEVANLVFSPGDDLDEILTVNDDISLSQSFYDLSKLYQAAAEYYLLLSEKLNDVDTTVDVDCEDSTIVLSGDHPVLDELVVEGFLLESNTEDDNTDNTIPWVTDWDDTVDSNWRGVDEDDYPYEFEYSEAE